MARTLRRGLALALGTMAALLVASPTAAHSLVGRVDSPLPLVVYLAGAALAVALSFLFVIVRDVRVPAAPEPKVVHVPRSIRIALRSLGLLAWVWIVVQTIVGGSSDADVATLFLWVYGWVGVAIISTLVAPVWIWIDPFATLYDIGAATFRLFGGVSTPSRAIYPDWLQRWPAAIGLAFFVWLELVFMTRPGAILILYSIVTLAAMAYFGRDTWRAKGETFSVWFGTLNMFAPLGVSNAGPDEYVERRPFGSALFLGDWPTSRVVLVAIGTGSILYDGLSQTQFFFDRFSVPPLATATLLLAGFLAAIVLLVLAVGRLVGLAAVGAGLIPIAAGYMIAHYTTYLVGDGQRIVVALSDPLQLGWDLFGTAFYEPSTSWIPAALLWALMLSAVVGGHVVGAWTGHVAAAHGRDTGHALALRQIPLAILMVALTATTLWSLGQNVVRETPAAATAFQGEQGYVDKAGSRMLTR